MSAIFKVVLSAFLGIFKKVLVDEFFVWLFFYSAEALVKSTKTPHDDAFLAKVKLLHDKEEKKKDGK